MVFTVTFILLYVVPGTDNPIVYREEMSIERCLTEVTDIMTKVRTLKKSGHWETGCMIDIPIMKEVKRRGKN